MAILPPGDFSCLSSATSDGSKISITNRVGRSFDFVSDVTYAMTTSQASGSDESDITLDKTMTLRCNEK